VSTELAGPVDVVKRTVLLSDEDGAQTTLIVASYSGRELLPGKYYHNTFGTVNFDSNDNAVNWTKADVLYQSVNEILAPYLK
jgi:hypothetical protein